MIIFKIARENQELVGERRRHRSATFPLKKNTGVSIQRPKPCMLTLASG
jgi:hypothetical protein